VAKRTLSVPERHQLRIALDTLKMNDVMARVMGGPSKEEARQIVKRLTGKEPRKRNPALHSVKVIGSNMTEADHGSVYILYSYETPVAIRPREGVDSKPLVTEKKWSTTTSKHIGIWLRDHGYTIKDTERLPQDMIEAIAKRGYYTKPPRGENPPRRRKVTYRSVGGLRGKKTFAERLSTKTFNLAPTVAFFKRHAGGIVGEASKGALALARAERYARDHDWETEWKWDDDADWSWLDQKGFEKEKAKDHEVYYAVLRNKNGTVLASLGGIFDPSREYQRVVEAELALEAMPTPKRKNPVRRGKSVQVRKIGRGQFVKRTTVLRATRGKRTVGRRRNPLIGVLGNPPADAKYLGKATYIEYTHGHDGKKYYHEFKPAVYAQVQDDGSLLLWHPTNNLWKLFPVSN
jgi:hypothetical protein